MLRKFLFLDFLPISRDAALLLWRAGLGGLMFLQHGLPKLMKVGSMPTGFPDPLGIGHMASYWATVGNEALAALLIVAGLFTRWAAFWLAFTMGVAFFIVHGADVQKAELALLFLLAVAPLVIAGGGRYSIDARLRNWRGHAGE